jgi:hypothetical protein
MIATIDHNARLSALAQDLRTSGDIGRSALINRLFGFLLEQSLIGRSPKEIEVAQEVFGKTTAFDVTQDASVRVHIHRLRRKLDEIYAGSEGERLIVPRGEYRLAVQSPAESEVPASPPIDDDPPPIAPPRGLPSRAMLLALCLALAIGAALGAGLWSWRSGVTAGTPLATTILWRPLAASRRMTFLATGDYYLFGESPNTSEVTRLVREFSINSREDLDQYLMTHPDDYGRYVDLDMHYLPVSTSYAQREVLPLMIDLTRQAGAGRPWAITMSRLTPEAIKGSNIVYIGFLSGLGMLRDPLFEASGFTVGASYDELIDRTSGKHYVSDWQQVKNSAMPRRDYAYIASFPGPSGNRILVISGTRDAAVMQAAEVATDKRQLDQIAARAGAGPDFEALYEVRTLGALNLGSTLVLARPLKLNRLWRPGAASGTFPDQMPALHAPAKPR